MSKKPIAASSCVAKGIGLNGPGWRCCGCGAKFPTYAAARVHYDEARFSEDKLEDKSRE